MRCLLFAALLFGLVGGCCTGARPNAADSDINNIWGLTETELRAKAGVWLMPQNEFCTNLLAGFSRLNLHGRVEAWARSKLASQERVPAPPDADKWVSTPLKCPRFLRCPFGGEKPRCRIRRTPDSPAHVDVVWGGGGRMYGVEIGSRGFRPSQQEHAGICLQAADGVYVWCVTGH